jgi:hypothetical protein
LTVKETQPQSSCIIGRNTPHTNVPNYFCVREKFKRQIEPFWTTRVFDHVSHIKRKGLTFGQRKNPNNIIINWQLLFLLTKEPFPKSLTKRLNEKENGAEISPNKGNLGLILRTGEQIKLM